MINSWILSQSMMKILEVADVLRSYIKSQVAQKLVELFSENPPPKLRAKVHEIVRFLLYCLLNQVQDAKKLLHLCLVFLLQLRAFRQTLDFGSVSCIRFVIKNLLVDVLCAEEVF